MRQPADGLPISSDSSSSSSSDGDDSASFHPTAPPRKPPPRPALNNALAEELRTSVRNRTSTASWTERPRLDQALTQELRQSARVMNEGREKKKGGISLFGLFRRSTTPNVKSSSAFADELRKSVHNREQRQQEQNQNPLRKVVPALLSLGKRSPSPAASSGRPTLSKDLQQELQKSFTNRNQKKEARRREIQQRILQRRESQRTMMLQSKDQSEASSSHADEDGEKRSMRNSSHHSGGSLKQESGILRPSKKDVDRRAQNTRQRSVVFSREASVASFAIDDDIITSPRRLQSPSFSSPKPVTLFTGTSHSADTFMAEFSDEDDNDNDGLKAKLQRSPSKKKSPNKVLSPLGMKSEEKTTVPISPMREVGIDFPSLEHPVTMEEAKSVMGTFDEYIIEWARITRGKRILKKDLNVTRKKVAKLSKEIDECHADNEELRAQLANAMDKVSKLSKAQTAEHGQFDTSTDLIAHARVDLAKALNENRNLKSQLAQAEDGLAEKEIQIQSLTETLTQQSDRIDNLVGQMKDSETELRYNSTEKRRLEDELAVVIASHDGNEVSAAIRRLEQEKSQWLDERETELEAKRLMLDNDFEKLVEREKNLKETVSNAETFKVAQASQRQEEYDLIQQKIEDQLAGMKDVNRKLQQRLTSARLDSTVEIKEQEHKIAILQQEVSKLQKELALTSSKKIEIRILKAEAASARDDYKDERRHNKILRKELQKRKKGKGIDDWKEIVLPGYRNMRGVTFGAGSESLAGFLTILVDEQRRQNRKTEAEVKESMKKFVKPRKKGRPSKSPKRDTEKETKTPRTKRSTSRKGKSRRKKEKKKSIKAEGRNHKNQKIATQVSEDDSMLVLNKKSRVVGEKKKSKKHKKKHSKHKENLRDETDDSMVVLNKKSRVNAKRQAGKKDKKKRKTKHRDPFRPPVPHTLVLQ